MNCMLHMLYVRKDHDNHVYVSAGTRNSSYARTAARPLAQAGLGASFAAPAINCVVCLTH